MEPLSLGVLVVVLAVAGLMALLIGWWMVKSAVRMAVKAIVFMVATVVVLGAVGVGVAFFLSM